MRVEFPLTRKWNSCSRTFCVDVLETNSVKVVIGRLLSQRPDQLGREGRCTELGAPDESQWVTKKSLWPYLVPMSAHESQLVLMSLVSPYEPRWVMVSDQGMCIWTKARPKWVTMDCLVTPDEFQVLPIQWCQWPMASQCVSMVTRKCRWPRMSPGEPWWVLMSDQGVLKASY